MATIAVARPFTLNLGVLPMLRYGVGVYQVSDEVADHWWTICHCQDAVEAEGELVWQDRALPQLIENTNRKHAYSEQPVIGPMDPSIPPNHTYGFSGFVFPFPVDGRIVPAPWPTEIRSRSRVSSSPSGTR